MDEEGEEASLLRLEQAGCQQRFPGTAEEAESVEELLVDEMSKLTMLEQNIVSFEVHGIALEIEETEDLITQSLSEMEKALQQIKRNKSAYEKALNMNPEYVGSRSFRLQFLRCEAFNCNNAANRLRLHFQQKEELFGSGDVLVRDVRLSDLDESALEIFKSGALQMLPTRDVRGRPVMCMFLSKWKDVTDVKGGQSFLYYTLQCAVQDEGLRQKGLVVIFYVGGKKAGAVSLDLVRNIYRVRLAVPHRLEAMHYCYDNEKLRPFVSGVRLFMDKRVRMRSRVHFGNEQRILFQLQTYGIPIPENSPFRLVDGEFSMTWHEEWLQIRQAQEVELAESNVGKARIMLLHRFDVLFGKGTNVRSHTGNLRALHLVNMFQSQYDGASNRFEKAEISERIISIIHESNGRFLKWDQGSWFEVDDGIARDKISHWFRNQRRSKADKDTGKKGTTPKRNRSISETRNR
ncbi:unnamed protein product [Cylindrotheca closterium]|uniref:DUF6824 domain-containing protein n=1 Tax=Cylindrotheca closterium TaxID=2856 RepID=A0AAD2FS92_9STRA|nr:unnamed protein product [Cylindrotheca closterium]